MNIPSKNPTPAERDAVVLAGMKQISGNDAAAEALFAAMSESVKDSNYEAIRTMTIGQTLEADATLVGKKVSLPRAAAGAAPMLAMGAEVKEDGNGTITGYAGDGCVTITVPVTLRVKAEQVKGLLQ